MAERVSHEARLLTLKEVAVRLSLRDVRTVRRQLAALGVPIVAIGRNHRVPAADLERALAGLPVARGTSTASQPPKGADTRTGKRAHEFREADENGPYFPAMARPHSKSNPRSGWVEKVEEGLYRNHRVRCRASHTRKVGVRCTCPWAAHVPTPKGWRRRVLEGARTKSEAILAKRLLQGQRAEVRLDGLDGTITLTELKDIWLRTRPYAETSRRQHQSNFRCYIEERFGKRRICDLRRLEMEQFSIELHEIAEARRAETKRRNPNFVKQTFATLSTALGAAVEWGLISANPAAGIKHPPCDPTREDEEREGDATKVLLRPQLQTLYARASQIGDPYKAVYWEVAFRCGGELALRVGEVAALRWSDFDLDRARVDVERKIDRVTRKEGPTKGRERRALALTPELTQLLRTLRRMQLARGCFAPDGWLLPGRSKQGRVNPETLTAKVRTLLKRAGLVDGSGEALITFHGLRHSCATLLIREGMLEAEREPITLLQVSRFLGHRSVTTTEKTYIHLLDGDLDRLATVLSGSSVQRREARHLRVV
jgi:integrase